MKNLIAYLVPLILVSSSSLCLAADVQVQSGVNFDWWGDNKDNNARQISVPLRIQGAYKDFSAALLTAYTDTHLEATGQGNRSLSHILDTKLTTSYEVIGKLPVDILLGLDLNLPTGKTNLSQKELALIMDPDLISINNFGEGINVNPTITIAKEWGKWVAGIGLGYLWRGGYDFSSDINITDYKPGDIFNINAEIRYYTSPDLYIRLFGRHAWYDNDTVRGSNFYKEGDFTLFGVGLNYNKAKKWEAGLAFQGILRDNSKFQQTPGALVSEPKNSHGDEWICDLSARYLLDETMTLRSSLQGRYFTKNEYPSDSANFIGMREKLSLGVGATKSFTPHIEAGLDVKGFLKHDDEAHFPENRSARDYHGVSVIAMLTGRF